MVRISHGKGGIEVVMKKVAEVLCTVVIVLVFTISAAIAHDIPFSGFLGNKAVYDQLKREEKEPSSGGSRPGWTSPNTTRSWWTASFFIWRGMQGIRVSIPRR